MKPQVKTALVILVLAIAAGLFWGGALFSSKKRDPNAPPNLIVFSLDTLRADRLGTYNYGRETSPFLDSLASKSVLFENAVTTAPWTLPAHVSLFTGLYPSSHGVVARKGQKIGDSTVLFTELLKQRGYDTWAYVAGGYVSKRYGFGRGFDTFYSNRGERDTESQGFQRVLTMATRRLKAHDKKKPFFLFLHTYTVHCPYNPPAPYDSMFKSPNAEQVDPAQCGRRYNGATDFNANKALYLSDHYDGSVRFLDTLMKDFFAELDKQGVLDNTLVVITSDHGDEFYEHGRIGHGESLYRELLMVPLIMSGPGIEGRRVKEPVSLVDVFPTVIEALGLPASTQPQGRSLNGLLKGGAETPEVRLLLSELDHGLFLRSLMNPLSDHFILNLESNKPMFFDLIGDPMETKDISGSIPDQITQRRNHLQKMTQGLSRFGAGISAGDSQKDLEQLKTLGYL